VLAVVLAAAALLPHLYQAALPRRRPGRRRRVLPGTTSPRDGCGYEDVERTRLWRRPRERREEGEERGFSKRREEPWHRRFTFTADNRKRKRKLIFFLIPPRRLLFAWALAGLGWAAYFQVKGLGSLGPAQ
jgi:hypothetical protein